MKTSQQVARTTLPVSKPHAGQSAMQRAADNSQANQSLALLQRMADARAPLQRMEEDEMQGKFIQRMEEDEMQAKAI
ncbi:hypothetical protein [Yoonia sp.]|jgi:hypothetical protein|uniref:hypothetical protein n=1 Tax=Yoonia sp. TaxID=2212373 RepID=UPI0025F19897|nr:hypothetical protein [Yoonia sp.]